MAETSKRPAEGDRDQFGTRESNRLQALADQTAETARQIGDKGGNAFRSAAYTAADATQRAGDVAANTMSSAAEQGGTRSCQDCVQSPGRKARSRMSASSRAGAPWKPHHRLPTHIGLRSRTAQAIIWLEVHTVSASPCHAAMPWSGQSASPDITAISSGRCTLTAGKLETQFWLQTAPCSTI